MFNFIKEKLQKIYSQCTTRFSLLFGSSTIDQSTLLQLEKILLEADTGITVTRPLITKLSQELQTNPSLTGNDLKKILSEYLHTILSSTTFTFQADVILLVGINGSGKTTSAGKLGYQITHTGKTVLLVAADTFRAAAVEQLALWAQKSSLSLIKGKEGQDPASVIFTACQTFKENKYDLMIIDTAGRLQTKVNLMMELGKMRRIISQQLPDKKVQTLLVIDAMLGQNSLIQARLFHESTHVDGIILTKMDSTAKAGIVFAIAQELKIPIAYVSYGEQADYLAPFDTHNYINTLLNE